MSAREEVLARVRAATVGARVDEPARAYRRAGAGDDLTALLAERLADYRAEVHRVPRAEIAATIPAGRLGVPPSLPVEWRPDGAIEDHGLSVAELDALDGVLTGCTAAIAETGTLLLASPQDGRRALTLVPDLHVCVVLKEQIVASVPEGVAVLAERTRDGRHPVTLVSGPSATHDIELKRVEGVHGPRRLVVVIGESQVPR